MKVKCIRAATGIQLGGLYEEVPNSLTRGTSFITIINDFNKETSYYRDRFKSIEEHRDQQLNDIGIKN